VVRDQLLDYMAEYNATGLKRLRIKAMDCVGRLYRMAQTDEQRNYHAYQLMEVLSSAMPHHHNYADVSARASVSIDRHLGPSDMEALHRLVDEWGTQSVPLNESQDAHRLLDAIAARYSNAIRILRDPEGKVVAFFVSLPMHQGSVELVEEYAPGTITGFFPGEPGFPGNVLEADTFLGVLVGVNGHHARYDRRDLLGMIIRDGLAFVGRKIRAAVGVSDPELKELLWLLGFESHLLGIDGHTEAFVLDMRQRDFLIWVGSVVRAFNRPPVQAQYVLEEGILRQSLKLLSQPAALARTDLPKILGCSTMEAQRILTVLLTEKPVPPLSAEKQQILRLTYLERPGNADRLAMVLHLSRPTYYRMLQQGVAELCSVLRSGEFLAALIELGE
jgi:hypothetical protein